MITTFAIITSILAIVLLREHGGLTKNRLRQLASIAFLVVAYLLCFSRYGALRAPFVWLAFLSFGGMIIAYIPSRNRDS